MDYANVLKELEEACADFHVPATRVAAEQTLLAFQKTPNVLPVCQYILEHATNSMLLFHAVTAMKECFAREYADLDKPKVTELKNYLLNYVFQKPTLERYVCEQVLQVVAVIMKRSWQDLSDEEKESAFQGILGLIQANAHGQTLGIRLFSALTDEFSSTKASSIGLSWDFHFACKQSFERVYLRKILEQDLKILHEQLSRGDALHGAKCSEGLKATVSLAERILTWEFSEQCGQLMVGSFGDASDELVKKLVLPEDWTEILLNHDVLNLFFQLYTVVQRDEGAANHSRQCLVQLSGLRGPMFANEEVLCSYASCMLRGQLQLITSLSGMIHQENFEFGPAVLGVCEMINRLVDTVKLAVLCQMSEFFQYMTEIGKLTSTCLQHAATEVDDTWNMEAFDQLLEMWVTLVSKATDPYQSDAEPLKSSGFIPFLTNASSHVVEAYVQVRLEIAKQFIEDFDEDDGNFKDQDMYADQLIGVATLARMNPKQSIEALDGLLRQKFDLLRSHYQSSHAQFGDQHSVLFHEQIHWLLLIAGHVLCDGGQGEKPLVPDSLMRLSVAQDNSENNAIVSLSSAVFSMLEFLSLDPHEPMATFCSPLVAETLFWFIERWSRTYLLIEPQEYSHISASLAQAFGNGVGGQAILVALVDKLQSNFYQWNAEEEVLIQLIKIINTFAKTANIRNALLACEKFPVLIQFFTQHLGNFPEIVHSALIQAITLVISGASSEVQRQQYFGLVTGAVEKQFVAVLQRPDFNQVYQNSDVISQVLNSLDMLDGLALAADPFNTKYIHAFASRFFESLAQLLNIYQRHPEVEIQIIQLLSSLCKYLDFSELEAHQVRDFYLVIGNAIKVYSTQSLNKARDRNYDKQQENPYQDIVAFTKLLLALIVSEPSAADVAEILFFGTNQLIPLMTLEMLEIPKICGDYVELIAQLIDRYHDRLVNLPSDLFVSLMQSLEYALRHPIYDISRLAFQSIASLALFFANNPSAKEFLLPTMRKFLDQIMNMLLYEEFDMDLLEPASEALYLLIASQQEQLSVIAHTVIQQQVNPQVQVRLSGYFTHLQQSIPAVQTYPLMANCSAGFRDTLTKFLMDIRGVLRVK
ncbi:hypothetical protein K493DRAFT_311626 [Basidiobolus meristosporus CBS 931.73]|uniref:Exportin-4 n=1 Tax=Basidiobolus meristosporus CBS 931.73 TaxID=1314790 RepID=A0A1Y1Z0L7_9FUNG|nr:hypothetical protein K493DRAFT_311626 [Basidiobolus meristosporus CBS 931.73]|eukprot:ORY03726.1 hypothetical protein K493DRAFT_311626 [Basidiobolus meristosporus CBS 931.73]